MVHRVIARRLARWGGGAGLAFLMLASSLPAQVPVPTPPPVPAPAPTPPVAAAAAPARLRFTTGQVLVYKAEHATFASDAAGENKTETKSLLKLTRRWQVAGVDETGTAT